MRPFITPNLLVICAVCLCLSFVSNAQTHPEGQVVELEKTTFNNDGTSETQVVKFHKSTDGTINHIILNGETIPKNSDKYNTLVAYYKKTHDKYRAFQINEELSEKIDAEGNSRQQVKTTYGITSYAEDLVNVEEATTELLTDKLRKEMVKDGLVNNNSTSLAIVLTNSSLAINGISQKMDIVTKYRSIYEQHTGRSILSGSNIELLLVTRKDSY